MNKASEIGRERGGIKVYSDNFRVFGYGEKGDDWLRVDYDRSRSLGPLDEEVSEYVEEDKRPGLRLFMNRTLFGHVIFIKKDNPMLEITVNRERLIENEAFEELRRFVRLGVDFATVLYSNEVYKERKEDRKKKEAEEEARRIAEEEERRKAEGAQRRAEEERRKVEEERRKAEERARKAEEERRKAEEERREAEEERRRVEEERRKAEEERKKAEEVQKKIEKEEQKREKEKLELERSTLRVLASTGTLVLIFSHELQALIEDMEEMDSNFTSILKNLSEQEQENYRDPLESFSNRTDMIKELGEFLAGKIGIEFNYLMQ